MLAVVEPEIIEVVGEASKATDGVDAEVTSRGACVGDMLESGLHVEGKVIRDEDFYSACALGGEFHIGTDGVLIGGVTGVGVDDA